VIYIKDHEESLTGLDDTSISLRYGKFSAFRSAWLSFFRRPSVDFNNFYREVLMGSVTRKPYGIVLISASLFLFLFLSLFFSQSCGAQRYSSNGETIYHTGYNDQNERISFEGGPMWLNAHRGGCVTCHGASGRGGQPVMMLRAIPADIRYESLISGKYDPSGEAGTPYTDELIVRAIRQGIDPDGKPLDPGMPRWQMTDNDVRDVIEYLKSLK
jgi:cytochrome c oxidase subunit 2